MSKFYLCNVVVVVRADSADDAVNAVAVMAHQEVSPAAMLAASLAAKSPVRAPSSEGVQGLGLDVIGEPVIEVHEVRGDVGAMPDLVVVDEWELGAGVVAATRQRQLSMGVPGVYEDGWQTLHVQIVDPKKGA